MKLGNFTQESILEYRQKANSQLCQRPDGSIYGIPQDRECITGEPISDPGVENMPVGNVKPEEEQAVDQERQNLLGAAIDTVRQNRDQFQQLKSALAEKIEERIEQREQQPVNFEDLINAADETFSENFDRIDQAASELGNLGDIGARIFAYEVTLLEYEGNPEAEDHIRQEIDKLQNSFDRLNSTIQEEFNSIFNGLLQRGDADLARENANNTSIDLPEDHPFSEEDYRKELETLYALANNSVSSLDEVFYDGEERAWANPPRSVEENGEVYEFMGGINTGLSDDWGNQNAIFWHEFGHHIEFSNQDLAAAMRDWVLSRATSQTPVSLRELTNSELFGETEIALPGDFTHPYVGKIYEDDAYVITEAIAMSLQTFTNPSSMYNLYERDPEYFKLIVGSLLNL